MILTNSSSARVGTSMVGAIASSTSDFRQFMVYTSMNITTSITGTIGVIKKGPGSLTYIAACNYTGQTIINQDGITITSSSTLNGIISGPGSLIKTGTTTNLTLGGNNSYSGGTLCSGGIITFTSGNAFGTGIFTTSGNAQIVTGNTVTVSNNFQINSGITMQYRVNTATTLTLNGNIDGISGNINKTSTGVLRLLGNNTYTGSTNIQAGILIITKTNGAVTATASFGNNTTGLSVSFNVPPTSGMQFRFFPGATINTYASVTLINGGGLSGSYDRITSTLTIT